MALVKSQHRFCIACLLLFIPGIGVYAGADQCLTCHEALGDKPSTLFKQDIHHGKGISCAGCHGGNERSDDMEKAMSKDAGFIGIPKGDDISKMCATCHSSPEKMKQFGSTVPVGQLAQLEQSVHGKLSTSGKQHIAQCTTCHNAHGIVSVKDARSPVHPLNIVNTCASCHSNATIMRAYNPSLAVDQREKYRTSVHGMRNAKGDGKAAECASCHGSHDIRSHTDAKSRVYPLNIPSTCATCHSNPDYMKPYGIPTDQFDKFTNSVHGKALFVKQDLGAPACNDCHGNHGATPPGVESVSKVCGTCHALNADLFSSSPHKKAFDELGLPECATCHGNHEIAPATSALLGGSPDAVCSQCHSPTENAKGYATAVDMRTMIDSLQASEQTARGLVDEAEQKGMAISDAQFTLRTAHQARLESRTIVHAFNDERFRGVVNKGFAAAMSARRDAEEAIREYYFRRIGLSVATLIITLLAVSLWFYIKRLDRRIAPAKASQREAGT
jgi:hypothetical protein